MKQKAMKSGDSCFLVSSNKSPFRDKAQGLVGCDRKVNFVDLYLPAFFPIVGLCL